MQSIQKVIHWFDAYQRRHKSLGFPLAVIKKFGEDQAGQQAALLAYYGFLALFPLLLVLTTVLKLLIRDDAQLRMSIIDKATQYFPVVGTELQQNLHTLGSGWILAVGLLLSLYGARGVAETMIGGINHIWQVPHSLRGALHHRLLRSYATIVVGATGLILAPVISGYAVSVGGHGWVMRVCALLITGAILYLMFLALVRIALPTKIPLGDLRPAAIISTVGLITLQVVGGVIVSHQLKHFNNLYGTFAVVLGLLFWLYLQAQIFFYAIETASVRAHGLWPRAVDQAHLTVQDKKALRLYAERNSFSHDSVVSVVFKDDV